MKKVWSYVKIVLALFFIAISINMFLGPHHIADGGVSGIAILLEYIYGWNRALVIFILNCLMLLLAYLLLGKGTFFKILFGSLVLPVTVAIVPERMLTPDRLLSVVFGSAIFAIGIAILYLNHTSSGGTTIPPLIFKRYFNVDTSLGLLVTDALIVICNLFVFGVEEFLYAVLSIVLTSIIMDYIENGMKRKKSVIIMSENHLPQLRDAIMEKMGRGVTLLEAEGGYRQEKKQILLVVATHEEFQELRLLVSHIDPKTFMITSHVAEVTGKGFSYHSIE